MKKAFESLDPPIPLSASTFSIGEMRLVVSPLPEIVKLPMFDGVLVIAPIQDKDSRPSPIEITHLLEGIKPFLIRISSSLIKHLVCRYLNNL